MSPWNKDKLLVSVTALCAAVSGGVVVLIAALVVREAWPVLRDVGVARFVTDANWQPSAPPQARGFNLSPMIAGTILVSAGAMAVATPLGFLSAVFSRLYAPRPIARGYRILIELLAGIPSVVYGLWGLVVLAPIIRRWQPPGVSLLAGVMVLAIMILPTIALVMDTAIAAVPKPHLESAAALGLGRAATVFRVILPTAKVGILTALVLGAGRAIGETMAVLMVCGNVVQLPASVFDPVRTLTANIALEMAYATADHRAALFVSGLMLLGLIVGMVAVVQWLHREEAHDAGLA